MPREEAGTSTTDVGSSEPTHSRSSSFFGRSKSTGFINIKEDARLHDLVPEFLQRVGDDTIQSLIRTKEIKKNDQSMLDLFARRYIKAEKYSVEKAVARARAHAAWRESALPHGVVLEEEIEEQLAHNKVFLVTTSRDQRPVLIVRVKNHIPGGDIKVLSRFVIYCLECATYKADDHDNPDGKILALFDFRGIGFSNLDAKGLREAFDVLSTNFPERVRKIYMLDSPLIFDALWRIVRPFIDPVSRDKVEFISGERAKQVLHETIGEEHLPSTYYGTAEEVDVSTAFSILKA